LRRNNACSGVVGIFLTNKWIIFPTHFFELLFWLFSNDILPDRMGNSFWASLDHLSSVWSYGKFSIALR
jgi:hypothetical protein